MKNDLICNRCLYKNVPTHFTPCRGCNHNMDSLKDRAIEKSRTHIVKAGVRDE